MSSPNQVLLDRYQELHNMMVLVTAQIQKADIDWRHLAAAGITVVAVSQLRKAEPTLSLGQALEKVRAFQKS
ncbi:hypothetical protein [Achromobacter phage Motura]|uniref:Uncharacterized protein n=1 Tax=Achromobacter phage Motura TaxID=2591403 RepID=A0A514CSM0_9CAUD|nr:hypothetical protein H1O15_gp340 [Achromobacter phage Motura]QDH83466.1 hypothetical protein [Achromobacter phage Motura]